MIVATASECLMMTEASYQILSHTGIQTALGEIVIVEITEKGNILVGGPSIVTQMDRLIKILKTMNVTKILVDGAFSRKTISKATDACIFTVGAAYSTDMKKVIDAAKLSIFQFTLPQVPENLLFLDKLDHVALIDRNGQLIALPYTSVIQHQIEVLSMITNEINYLFLPGSFPSSFLKEIITSKKYLNLNIIIKSPTHMVLTDLMLKNLALANILVYVINPINLISIMYNPFSPTGYCFDDLKFQKALMELVDLPVINVMNERRKTNNDE